MARPSGVQPYVPHSSLDQSWVAQNPMNPAYTGLAAVMLYLVGAALHLRAFRARAALGTPTLQALAALAVLLHGIAAFAGLGAPSAANLGLYSVISLTSFALVALVLGSALLQRDASLQPLFLLVLPLGAAGALAGATLSSSSLPQALSGALLLHVLLSLFAYTVLLLAACQSLLLRIQERALKEKRDIALLRLLPPLQTMETVLFQWLAVGVALLSAAIASGFLFLDDLFEQRLVHHTVLALASWVAFGVLLLGRWRFGWRGATATRWTLVGFVLLLLGFLGSKFVLEVILGQ